MNQKIEDKEIDIINKVDNIVLEISNARSLKLNHYIHVNSENLNIILDLTVSPQNLIPNNVIDEIKEKLGANESFIQYPGTNKLSLVFKFD